MKKILISKFHEKSPSPPKLLDTNENPNNATEQVSFQPPLPIGPRPQELPHVVDIKKEVMDEGYQSISSESSPEFDPPVLDENIRAKEEEPSDPSTMAERPSGSSGSRIMAERHSGPFNTRTMANRPSGPSGSRTMPQRPSGPSDPRTMAERPSGTSDPRTMTEESPGPSEPRTMAEEPSDPRTVEEEPAEPSDPRSMCKRFVRGKCAKGSYCRFKHEIVPAELNGIYRFCWDYQNKVCRRTFCKHVHASIFEEHNFYRTGYLAPEATAHLPENQDPCHETNNVPRNNVVPEQQETSAMDFNFPTEQGQNGPPSTHHCMAPPPPPAFEYNYPGPSTSSAFRADPTPVKRTWNPIEELCSGLPEFATESKKCKQCDVNLFRQQISSHRLEERMRSVIRTREKIRELEAKTTRLNYITRGLMAVGHNKSLEDFINQAVSGRLQITEEKATEIIQAVNMVLNLHKPN